MTQEVFPNFFSMCIFFKPFSGHITLALVKNCWSVCVIVVLIVANQGPVVQSIVSLTTSLRRHFVKYMLTTLSNPLLFFVEKM